MNRKNNTRLVAILLPLAGALVGAAGGYFYWKYKGCSSGTCSITSSPVNSTLYFALLGTLLFSIFHRKPAKSTENKEAK